MQLKTAGPLFVHCTPITKLIFFQYLVYYYISRFRLLHKQLVLHKQLIFYYAGGCVTQAVNFLLRKRLNITKAVNFLLRKRLYYISSCYTRPTVRRPVAQSPGDRYKKPRIALNA